MGHVCGILRRWPYIVFRWKSHGKSDFDDGWSIYLGIRHYLPFLFNFATFKNLFLSFLKGEEELKINLETQSTILN